MAKISADEYFLCVGYLLLGMWNPNLALFLRSEVAIPSKTDMLEL